MLKKLVAITLAALMLINPMTAFAVSWGEMLDGLAAEREKGNNKYSSDDGVTLEVEGTNAKIYGDGILTDFYNVDEFTNYTFSGTIRIDGDEFEVYVHDVPVRDENGNDVFNDDGSQKMQAQQVVVNVESGVAIEATKVSIKADDNSTLVVTTKGNIGFDVDGNLVTESVSIDVNEEATANAKIEFTNEGDIAVNENIWMGVDGEGKLVVTNNGTMTAEKEIGMHAYGNGTGELTNNGAMTADASGNGEEGDQVGLGVHGEGSIEFVNGEDGVINGELTGWLDSDATNGTLDMTNEGTVNGDMGAWGFDGNYEDEDGNVIEGTTGGVIEIENTGDVTGNLGTFTNDEIASTITNSGTVEGAMFADNNGTKDMTVTNGGDTNSLSASNNGGANATVTNSGNVLGGEVRVEAGSGSLSFSNTGMIDGERFDANAYGEGTVTGTNSGSIDVTWGYVGSSDNGNSSFTNESKGNIHTDENFDIAAGNWNGEEDYEYNPNESSNTSFVNSGNVVTEGGFAGSLQENGSVTLENTETGTMTAVNHGVHIGINDNGNGSVTVNNAGTVNSEWFNVSSQTTGEASISNSGTVNGYMGAYADGVYDEDGNLIEANKDGKVNISNSSTGTVNGGMGSYVNGGGTGTVINSGEAIDVNAEAEGEGASVNLTNDGTAENVYVGAYDGATGTAVNTGTVGYVGASAAENGDITVTNNGIVTDAIDVGSYNDGTANITNDGTAENIYSGAFDGGTTTVTNNNTVNNEVVVDTTNGTLNVTNSEGATVGGQMDVWVFGEEGTANAVNIGTIGSSEDGNGVWVEAGEGGKVELTNDGTINGELGGASYEGSSTTINNTENGSAESSWINAHGGEIALNNEGEVKGTLSVSIGTQSNEVTSTDTVAQLLEQTGVDISGYNNVDIYTANQDGQLIARYAVTEDGAVTLVEIFPLEEEDDGNGGGYDDPKFWTKERIRHDKEEERKAAEIGGVFGSPFWLKQLYLGYMSLNLRLFSGEDQLLFKESLSWVPDTGKLGEKVLTLKAKTEDTSALTMRLDGSVIEKLEQAGIVAINIVDGAGNLFMEYKVQDLKDARAMYGLTEAEYIVVGAADADVLKIAEDGTVSPIEGETAEEVADEANKEATEETAEETPAA